VSEGAANMLEEWGSVGSGRRVRKG
jgi:hypothetical protein